MGFRIVAPGQDSRVGEDFGEEVAEPIHAIARRPSVRAMPVQPMHGDDTRARSVSYQKQPARRGRKTYSTTGLTPSAKTSKPWGTLGFGDSERVGEACVGEEVSVDMFEWK